MVEPRRPVHGAMPPHVPDPAPGAGPAVDDARAILARIEADEQAARAERDRLDREPLHAIEPDPAVAGALRPGELVFDTRAATRVEGPEAAPGSRTGRLHLTTERLVLTGPDAWELELRAVREVALAGERLLLALLDGSGASLDAAGPRVLRVRLAHLVRALR